MAKRNAKGEWEFTDEDESQIAMATEARVRASRRVRQENELASCKRGKHDDDGKGTCVVCGEKMKAADPTPDDKPKPDEKTKSSRMLVF
jgi:hypothetical protein